MRNRTATISSRSLPRGAAVRLSTPGRPVPHTGPGGRERRSGRRRTIWNIPQFRHVTRVIFFITARVRRPRAPREIFHTLRHVRGIGDCRRYPEWSLSCRERVDRNDTSAQSVTHEMTMMTMKNVTYLQGDVSPTLSYFRVRVTLDCSFR